MSTPHRSVAVVALVVVALAAGAAAAGAPSGPGADGGVARQVDADQVRMTVALADDGDARWTVTYRVRLEDDNETAAFESLRDDVAANPDNYTGRFGDRMRATAGTAENATGREMTVRNVSVDARIQTTPPRYGVLEYTFEWTNFAVVDGDTVTAGDALAGLFLDGQTSLVMTWPEGYGLVAADPDPTPDLDGERSVGWAGAREFAADEPRLVVREGADGPGGADDEGLPAVALVGGLLVVVLVAAGGIWYQRRRVESTGDSGPGGAAAGAAGGADGGGATTDDPPEELLSNEEKVLRLVRERGGRVKQQEIVEAFDWTEAKTSQVVRDLREGGDLDGFRLGRENVLRLPEEGDDPGEGG
jgi:hypothetical protein